MSEVIKNVEWYETKGARTEIKKCVKCNIGLFVCVVDLFTNRSSIYASVGLGSEAENEFSDSFLTVEEAKQWCLDKVKEVCEEALAILEDSPVHVKCFLSNRGREAGREAMFLGED